jgi:D-tyrosyl-tRNA(Tyr) deacylase
MGGRVVDSEIMLSLHLNKNTNMRVVIQRVKQASVTIEHRVYSTIGKGLLIFLGVAPTDETEDIVWLCGKIARLRIFTDSNGVMNLSLADVGAACLVVSQFTLFASIKKGNRPSYIGSASPAIALPLYERFVQTLALQTQSPIQTGIFGADMHVALLNDGPVTLFIDSKNKE